ncbi:hypothetical protein HYS31_03905 [Candidatus Woesearchaeota archaeon]|nr:hypothetical protein [Candidatus Woesearchaeota archaeon]
MKHSKLLDFIGIIWLFIGLFFAFLPHTLHARAGFEEQQHITHLAYGIVTAVVSIILLAYNNNSLKSFRSKITQNVGDLA